MPPVTKVGDQPDLVPTSTYPYAKFPFEHFNVVQSRLFDYYDKENSVVIAAATSAGKTVCAEMMLAYEIRKRGGKGMYLAPMRALAQEKIDDWTSKAHHFGDLKICICTGDYRLTPQRHKELAEADLVVATTEMFNSHCRNILAEKSSYLSEVGTLILDEAHLLSVPGRGDHIECGLMRFFEHNRKARLVALSATMPNVSEIADWVSYVLTQRDTVLIESTFRPCPLFVHYEKYWDGESTYDENEAQKVNTALQIIQHYPDDKFLAFVHTKRTGESLKQSLTRAGIDCEFHNADLEKEKRVSLERRFKQEKKPQVVVATSTLAWGCCVGGTLVSMADDSFIPIEKILPGDKVWALNRFSLNFTPAVVLHAGPRSAVMSLKFTLATGESVVVSNEHRFFGLTNKGVEYYRADHFRVGDQLAIPGPRNEKGYFSLLLRPIEIIEEMDGREMFDIAVAQHSSYISGGIVSHNCNLPARRVVILGVHRAMDEVADYDIRQEIGRAGRPQYDPAGDAYILLPEGRFDYFRDKMKKPSPIRSQMLDLAGGKHKVLAFHLVNEINQENVKNKRDVHRWYERSLAHFQSQELDSRAVDDTLDLLKQCGAIREEGSNYTTTAVGKVASMFYFSPFDVSNLRRNFRILFNHDKQDDDLWLSVALGNIDTHCGGIVSRAEREEMTAFHNKIRAVFPGVLDPAVKAAYAYYSLLNGTNVGLFGAICRNLQYDFPRLAQVLQALDSFGANWGKKDWFRRLQIRVTYGVKGTLTDLCQLPDVGKVRANKLWSAGLKSLQDVVDNPARVRSALRMSTEKCDAIIAQAKKLLAAAAT